MAMIRKKEFPHPNNELRNNLVSIVKALWIIRGFDP